MELMIRRLAVIVVVASLFAMPLARATSPPDERVLLPVVVDNAAGAFGSHWTTTITYLYRGFAAIEVGNDVNLNQFITAGRGELHLANVNAESTPGRVLDAPAPQAGDLYIQTHVYEASSPSGGVIIPAVRSADWPAGAAIHLIGVPVSASARTLLRLYEIGASADDLDVVVHVSDGDAPILTTNVHLAKPAAGRASVTGTYPAYAEVSIPASASGSVSIDVDSVPAGFKVWGFTTTTDNRNQSITPVFPAR